MLSHVAWFNEAQIEPDPKGGLRSSDERVRRRCLEPACALEDLGTACSVFGNLHDADPTQVSKLLQKLKADIVVIGPFTDPSLLRLARAAKHLGCYVVADFGDAPSLGEDFEKLAAFADLIVAATPDAETLLMTKGIAATVIPDTDKTHTAEHAAKAWRDCFQALKMKPPACANSNVPLADNG
jgi:hypothetical protein